MKQFNDDNFVLETQVAQDLYHNHAAKMPIIDYHCHLIPEMVATDHRFKSITELWLGGDHYKWRAMRTNGVDEKYCTGKDTSDWEKFEKWAETVPYTFRNPLYHWTRDLRRVQREAEAARVLCSWTDEALSRGVRLHDRRSRR